MGFTKLDDGLIFSSILREDDAVFKVWVLLLSRTDGDGIARVSADFLAGITRKPDEEIARCLSVLEKPDPSSRTRDHEGRRIERVNGGFKVLNYQAYRETVDRESIRAYEADRKRRQRERETAEGECPGQSGTVPGLSASASLSASVGEGGTGGRRNPLLGDRDKRIREGYELIRRHSELRASHGLANADPVEILALASHYDGAKRQKLNLDSMTDDRLLATLRDLQANYEADMAKIQRGARG